MSVGEGFDLPQGSEPWSDFHWFQSSVRGDLDIVILSSSPIHYIGHFVGGRMCPCAGSGCELCSIGTGGQVRYVFAVAEVSSKRVGLIEFGKSNGQLIRDWSGRAGCLRGLRVVVRKHSKNPQSRTEVQYIEESPGNWYLSLIAPDPALALYLTWNKMQMAMPETFAQRMREVVHNLAGKQVGMTEKERFMEKAALLKKGRSVG